MEGSIDHFLHKHPLTLIEQVNQEFLCRGCGKSLPPDEGPIYGCSGCKFYLDKACAELPKEMQHFFHPCPLFLELCDFFICDACLKRGNGFIYRCRRCNFDMHVECAQRPNIKSNGDGNSEETIEHFTHWHPLRLVDGNQKKDLQVGYCGICQKLISCFDPDPDPGFVAYGCEECNFFVHKSCIINIPRQINNHSFHPSCPLIPVSVPSDHYPCDCYGCWEISPRLVFRCGKHSFQLDVKCALLPTLDQSKDTDEIQYVGHRHPLVAIRHNKDKTCIPQCGACLGSIDRFVHMYRCDNCDFNLHFDCAIKHKHTTKQLLVKYEGHSHPLTFFDKIGEGASCDICEKGARNCIFRCVACDFDIHLHCHPSAPKTITHKSHLHPLTLTESPFDFEFVSPQYRENSDRNRDAYNFYCDVCEEKRFKPESVYYCKECKFIAETRCVISELLPFFSSSEDHPTGEDGASSRNDDNSALEAYIAELKEKKRPLESEIEKLKATLEALEVELEPINLKLKQAEKDFLINSLLSTYNK
ncbi:DC1 domain-containing protein [Corchorus olitorius]|uniref:DC1 domain-containing protein n=1 Tax=Corchorus olitorius TaxID=93759 RepID=A0A1R3L3R7_9ROSI|nr:DC1 domain-containing protein [Corchorus olitorius]